MHVNGYSLVCRHPKIFINYHYSTSFISHQRFKSVLDCGKFRANIARLNSGEIALCFLEEVVALGLVALFYLKIHLEDNLEEFLVSLKISFHFSVCKELFPKGKKSELPF